MTEPSPLGVIHHVVCWFNFPHAWPVLRLQIPCLGRKSVTLLFFCHFCHFCNQSNSPSITPICTPHTTHHRHTRTPTTPLAISQPSPKPSPAQPTSIPNIAYCVLRIAYCVYLFARACLLHVTEAIGDRSCTPVR
ncbi:hypothetical protein EX30DRAFT_75152 [Ascodesmis nigricans]|uniref:Uncharacterized protein n=1 Tax=Ascodesmis nigricans TaxID=341454 RepID=A0A4V3SID8_9PEZI|nr:hypothetical protein EX30DRAFT_75152 [Ascodesmis nigricans]